MRTLESIVLEHRLFEGLAPKHAYLIAGCARNVRFGAGEFLFREGEPADTFYVLRHGRVTLETFAPGRGAVTIDTVEEGDVVGWSWLFPPYRWHFDARALDQMRAIAFDGACLRGKCEEDHELGYQLHRRFAQVLMERLQAARVRLLDVYGHVAAR